MANKKRTGLAATVAVALGLAGFVAVSFLPREADAAGKAVVRVAQVQTVTFNGACGGGNTISQVISGWRLHGVLDDVALDTGQTPGIDGSAASIVRAGMVKTIVVKGGWVTNFTCKGGRFDRLSKAKYIPSGAVYWVPARLAPAPCKTRRTHLGYQGNCGNKQVGNLLVRRPCASKPHPGSNPSTTTVTVPGGDCNVINSPGGQACNVTIITVTVVCGNLQMTFSGTDAETVKQEATQWAQANCTAPPTTQTTSTTTTPTTTTVVTTTVPTTTTTETTTTAPKSDVDLCINIDGIQTAVPAGFYKDPQDRGIPGNCFPAD